MDGANYSLSMILEKVQQLTEAENAVVESQRSEILSLREQLRQSANEIRNVSSVGSFSSDTDSDRDDQSSQRYAQNANAAKREIEADIEELEASKARINEEIQTLKKQVTLLASERTSLIKEVEVYGHMSELACELEEEHNARRQLENQIKELRKLLNELLAERDIANERAETESMIREEMQKGMRALYEEKISHEKQIADLQASSGSNPSSVASSMYEEDIRKLKKEIDIIRAENKSLRVTAKREAASRQILNDEMKSLSAENFMIKRCSSHCEDPRYSAASRKRALAMSQGSVGEDEKEYKRSISYEPRDRLDSGGSDNSAHERDDVSVLFGQDSIAGGTKENPASIGSHDDDSKSDHKGIRAHAEKLLYWANKAAERQKTSTSSSSVASGSVISRQNSVPATIGLPPRGQSRVTRKTGRLPPRPPQVSYEDGAFGTDRTEASGSFGDKENGTGFNIGSKQKQNKAVIFNLDKVQRETSCQCSASPFSGSDAHAEFYLPKLGLACTCGESSIVEDRQSFSKNPTSLKNILRSWQCDYLQSLDVETADQLLRMHKSGANNMARKMKMWREEHNMPSARSKECYVALQIWTRTAKVVLRSIKKQKEAGEDVIEKPGFLDISMTDTHSVSTLGQLSSVGGRMPFEMVEI